ncbi:MAG: DUF1569 domain-containing protein [Planctomycetota bacterium]
MSLRELHFDSFDQAIDEVNRLASGPTTTVGHYSHGQILEHLARALDMSLGKASPPKVGLPLRILGRLIRNMAIHKPMKPGFKLPKGAQDVLWPTEAVTVEQGMAHLIPSAAEFMASSELSPNPFFGKLTKEQHLQLQSRHFAMHLGFIYPSEDDS